MLVRRYATVNLHMVSSIGIQSRARFLTTLDGIPPDMNLRKDWPSVSLGLDYQCETKA